jgi:hypothetical protein
MDTQLLLLALVAIGLCSVITAFTLPALVASTVRGKVRETICAGVLIAVLTAIAFVIAAVVGANPAIYGAVL